MTSINLNDRDSYPLNAVARAAEVWTKPEWSSPWTLRPDLFPVQSVWKIAPDVSTATLEYRYGSVLVPGSATFQTLVPITARGYWVLIRWRDANFNAIDWLGYAETPVTRDRYTARDDLPESGKQTIPCFGLIRALEQCLIRSTVYVDPENDERAKRSDGTGSTFNEGTRSYRHKNKSVWAVPVDDTRSIWRGNRSSTKRNLVRGGPKAYVFAHPNDDESTWWSTRDIVEHIATFHLPTATAAAESGGVPWKFMNADVLPNWDRPTVGTDMRDVASVLNQLINPSRMMGYGIGIQGSGSTTPNITAVTINPFSMLAEPLVLPLGTIPANTSLIALSAGNDPLTTIVVDEDATDVVDQVVVQGPREIAVCTLTGYPAGKASHEKGWTTAEQNEYEAGASPWLGFATASIDERRSSNERFRTTGKMRDIYSLYRLKEDWDGKVNDEFLFAPQQNEDDEDIPYVPAPQSIEILDHLPLFAEISYADEPETIDESLGLSQRQPVLSLRKRNADGTLSADRLYVDPRGRLTLPEELLKGKPFRLDYEIDRNINVRLIVRDAPQHAIAGKGFIGNLGDLDQETTFGDIYYEGWNLTVAIRGDRRPSYSIPADSVVAGYDVVRRKIITLDDESLLWVYISKNAEVGFKNDTPNTVKSPGGVLRNPMPILQSICTMLAQQHGQPRRRAVIRTARRISQIELGSVLQSVDTFGSPIGSLISEVRIDSPMSDGPAPPAATVQQFIASPYRADVLGLLRTPAQGRRTNRLVKRPQKGAK